MDHGAGLNGTSALARFHFPASRAGGEHVAIHASGQVQRRR